MCVCVSRACECTLGSIVFLLLARSEADWQGGGKHKKGERSGGKNIKTFYSADVCIFSSIIIFCICICSSNSDTMRDVDMSSMATSSPEWRNSLRLAIQVYPQTSKETWPYV